jgi:putative transcriptional regulator
MSQKYKSEGMAAIHETMKALHKAGAIDKPTMRRFDQACQAPARALT